MENYHRSEVIYQIATEDVQNEAKRIIGRELTEDELPYAKKGVETGLSFVEDITLRAAIEEAVDKNAALDLISGVW